MRILAALALAPFVVGVAAQPPVPKPDAAPAAAKTQDEFCQAPKSLRTAVREKGVRIERGNDPKRGAWLRDRDGVTALQGPTHQQEIDKVRSEVRLCRQVLRFLDPARLIGEMADWVPLRTDDLAIMRLRYPRCLAAFVQGVGFTTFNGRALPLDLGALGMPGCDLWVVPEPVLSALVAHGGGSADLALRLPADPRLVGVTLASQVLTLDPAAPGGVGAVANAGIATLH